MQQTIFGDLLTNDTLLIYLNKGLRFNFDELVIETIFWLEHAHATFPSSLTC